MFSGTKLDENIESKVFGMRQRHREQHEFLNKYVYSVKGDEDKENLVENGDNSA